MSIDELIKSSETEKLLRPNRNLWKDVEQRLDERDRRSSWQYYIMSAAASLVILVSAWGYLSTARTPYAVEDLISEASPIYDVELVDQLSESYEAIELLSRLNG